MHTRETVLGVLPCAERFLARCARDPDRPGHRFPRVALPELQAYYAEDWDDTNFVWYASRERVEPLLEWARACELHVLDDGREAERLAGPAG